MTKEEVEKLIAERYQSLPPKLKLAARHVLDSPKDIAIQSMRSVAADAKLQPPCFDWPASSASTAMRPSVQCT
jgi:DNA-binding MurR/RpiR family transcriptional regulator